MRSIEENLRSNRQLGKVMAVGALFLMFFALTLNPWTPQDTISWIAFAVSIAIGLAGLVFIVSPRTAEKYFDWLAWMRCKFGLE